MSSRAPRLAGDVSLLQQSATASRFRNSIPISVFTPILFLNSSTHYRMVLAVNPILYLPAGSQGLFIASSELVFKQLLNVRIYQRITNGKNSHRSSLASGW